MLDSEHELPSISNTSSLTFLKWLTRSTKMGSIKAQNGSGENVYLPLEFISDATEIPLKGEISFSPVTVTRGDHDSLDVLALWVHVDSDSADRIGGFALDPSCIANSGGGIDLYWKLKKDHAGELPSIGEAKPYLEKFAEWFGSEANTDQLLRLPVKFDLSEWEYDLANFGFLFKQEETESPRTQDTEESFPESPEIVEDKPLEIDASQSEQIDGYPKEQPTEEEASEDMSDLGGWIKLHRKIIDNPIFKDSFTYHLFSYLLLRANHKPERFLFNGSEISVGRGEFITGIEKISAQTGITPKRIRLRLGILESLHMIARKTTNRFSIITICNYNLYQSPNTEKGQAKGQAELPRIKNSLLGSPGQAKGKQRATNKNDKNIKHYVEDSDEFRLVSFLLEEIRTNKPDFKQPNLQSWAREVDLMIRQDGRDPDRIRQVIEWCQRDSFWWGNILSTRKLREKFEQLEAKMVSAKGKYKRSPREEYLDVTGVGRHL